MDMVRLKSVEDYEKLPLTSWKIKQPSDSASTSEDCLSAGIFFSLFSLLYAPIKKESCRFNQFLHVWDPMKKLLCF